MRSLLGFLLDIKTSGLRCTCVYVTYVIKTLTTLRFYLTQG